MTEATAEVVVEDPADLLRVLANIDAAKKALAEQHEQVQERLIAILDSQGRDVLQADMGQGQKVRGKVVRAERVVIDEPTLLGHLDGLGLGDKVTKRVLDKGLLEAHVKTGEIKPDLVAACSEVKQNKPFIKISGDTPATPLGLGEVATKSSSGGDKAAVKRVKARKGGLKINLAQEADEAEAVAEAEEAQYQARLRKARKKKVK